jgi:hypothetical protein
MITSFIFRIALVIRHSFCVILPLAAVTAQKCARGARQTHRELLLIFRIIL